jgi:hypothetical protein
LVLESDESNVESDRRVIRQEIARAQALDHMIYEHIRAFEEPLLAVPDAIGWCWAKGGHWRIKVKSLVAGVHVT